MRKIALYARVSTKDQEPETQLVALREYARARELEILGEFVDVGISGAKDRRPQLERLMKGAHRREFDAVLVARFDRFARSTRDSERVPGPVLLLPAAAFMAALPSSAEDLNAVVGRVGNEDSARGIDRDPVQVPELPLAGAF